MGARLRRAPRARGSAHGLPALRLLVLHGHAEGEELPGGALANREGPLEDLDVRILVTGNMGYVGPSVVHRLRIAYPGAELIGLDMGYFAHILSGADLLPECRLDR